MTPKLTLEIAVSRFGRVAKAKLNSPSAVGQPEDQLRAPFERLLEDLAALGGLSPGTVVAIGETALSELRTRPDYAVTLHGALAGFVEVKAPGKGADPRRLKGAHDKAQWSRLRSLPNLLYTDGNEFSLWHHGESAGPIVRLHGDVETSGDKLAPGPGLETLFEAFLQWQPQPPLSARELAEVSARLCRLLRQEVADALARKSEALTTLAADWRELLFPTASDEQFADGYAQAVTFGLLMARARGIAISDLHHVAVELRKTSSLIGTALQLLTDEDNTRHDLATSLRTLERVLAVVDWAKISKGSEDAWLYFYEEFLAIYDNALRKKTGSYYTPPEVVEAMVRLTDQALRRPGFSLSRGLATPSVTVADPATGTGTFVLGVLRNIANTVRSDQGPGAVPAAIEAALQRVVAFELQLGPFAVAQLRVLAEAVALIGDSPKAVPRMFVTDTLGNPDDDGGHFPGFLAAIGKQRKAANQIKRDDPITVVIGNPPYKEKAKGLGGWIEGDGAKGTSQPPLQDWMPPPSWGLGVHAKHLRNLYVYFWRWATWKVFDHPPKSGVGHTGIVSFITVSGFLAGPGFERMRQYLRTRCDDVWVIDCSPEGHQPGVSTRIFQDVQQPVCIVMASRWNTGQKGLAKVRWRALPSGDRTLKFEELGKLALDDSGWLDCSSEGRSAFLPAATLAWASYPALDDYFEYDGSGVMPGRTWVIAPDPESLAKRWKALVAAPTEKKEMLFHPHLRDGKPGDKHFKKIVAGLPGFATSGKAVADETGAGLAAVRYGYRSFDRQWILPDARLINQPNAKLWTTRSDHQVYITAFSQKSPTSGPALTLSGLVPDLDHYKGSFGGRVFPLWADGAATITNLHRPLVAYLATAYGQPIVEDDLFSYIVALTAHPAYIERFRTELATPGLRIPLTASGQAFRETAALGRQIVWLHTFGERMADAAAGRPLGAPRLSLDNRPRIAAGGAIPSTADDMPDRIWHDTATQTLWVGSGRIAPVPAPVWSYEISGKNVLTQWFSYRRKSRERPLMGDRRAPSQLGQIQPDVWLAEYTTELLDLINVLGLLVELEPRQSHMLDRVLSGPLLSLPMLHLAGASPLGAAGGGGAVATDQPQLF